MYLLGISAFYHDSAAALIKDGLIVAAAQEERFTRIKNDASFPLQTINFCLSEANISIHDVDQIIFYEDTHLKFDRITRSYIHYLPRSFRAFHSAMTRWLTQKIHIESSIKDFLGVKNNLSFVPHHISHAASAFYPSKFNNAAILIIDGVGEWATTSIGIGENNKVRLLKEITYPHSLGMLYSAFTQFAGFLVNSGEYKLMGLAPYGKPIYREKIFDNLIDVKSDGSFRLNLKYFDFHHGRSTINSKFEKLFETSRRTPESDIREIDQDMAASIQSVFNDIILKLATTAKQLTKSSNLVIAGGVGLNCVSNGHVAAKKIFDHVWAQPAAGDAGGALGAALYVYYNQYGSPRKIETTDQGASHLGPSFKRDDITHVLELFNLKYEAFDSTDDLNKQIVGYLLEENVIGFFQGKMEFGPRALGARSILGDPRSEKMQKTMNLQIKYRESFRPFAPAILKEHAQEIFEIDYHSPHMQFVVPLRKDKQILMKDTNSDCLSMLYQKRSDWPAITHVDYSARPQLVDRQENPILYDLIKEFHNQTGCPMLINTSFNIRGEPIVCTPLDALKCFFSNEIDILVLDQFIIRKPDQNWDQIGRLYYESDFFNV
jgi:carbamoyltransferase